MERKDPQQAFQDAIDCGRLSDNPTDDNYAGHFMYMGRAIDENNSIYKTTYKDAFKSINTRQYIV